MKLHFDHSSTLPERRNVPDCQNRKTINPIYSIKRLFTAFAIFTTMAGCVNHIRPPETPQTRIVQINISERTKFDTRLVLRVMRYISVNANNREENRQLLSEVGDIVQSIIYNQNHNEIIYLFNAIRNEYDIFEHNLEKRGTLPLTFLLGLGFGETESQFSMRVGTLFLMLPSIYEFMSNPDRSIYGQTTPLLSRLLAIFLRGEGEIPPVSSFHEAFLQPFDRWIRTQDTLSEPHLSELFKGMRFAITASGYVELN